MRAVILMAHGSRDPLWRAPIEAVRDRVAAKHPDLWVHCAYLEWTTPAMDAAIASAVAAGAHHVTVVPMFLGTGKHARHDIPALLAQARAAHPQIDFHLQRPIAEDDRLTDAMADIAAEPAPGKPQNP